MFHRFAANFQRNGHLGWIVWGGIMFDYVFRSGVMNTEFVQPPFQTVS
jgi:hypothetical protein